MKAILIAFSVGAVFVGTYHGLSALFPAAHFWIQPIGEFGFAWWVAGATALLFEVVLQKRVVGGLLKRILGVLEDTSRHVEHQTRHLLQNTALLQHAAAEGLVAIHRRGDRSYHEAVRVAVGQATEYVIVGCRAGQEILGTEQDKLYQTEDLGWLMPRLLECTAAVGGPPVYVLLADGFQEDNQFRREVAWRKGIPYAMRETARGLLMRLEERGLESRFGIRVIGDPPPPWSAIVTEQRIFVEHYLPNVRGGSSIVFEIAAATSSAAEHSAGRPLSLFEAYREDVVQLYHRATPISEAIQGYVAREQTPQSPREMVERAAKALPIAMRCRDDAPGNSALRSTSTPSEREQHVPNVGRAGEQNSGPERPPHRTGASPPPSIEESPPGDSA